MVTAYIGLGSNLGNPAHQLRSAVAALADIPATTTERLSSVYRSRAVGPGEQPDYLNAVAQLCTALPALALLGHLQQIEQRQGRERSLRWGARTLDLDLLLYGDERLQVPGLTVPHVALAERNFVLYPLAEVAGLKLLLPGGTELGTLVAACPLGELTKTNQNLRGE